MKEILERCLFEVYGVEQGGHQPFIQDWRFNSKPGDKPKQQHKGAEIEQMPKPENLAVGNFSACRWEPLRI
jgi:hypothetical protein